MACNTCNKRRGVPAAMTGNEAYAIVFGNYKFLTDRQLKARLENYKRNFCKECSNRYECDLSLFMECKKIKI